MIQKYIYGTPIETGAVVQNIEETKADFSLMKLEKCEETMTFTYKMERKDVVFGLGEQVRGMNKRGFTYISNASDQPTHTEDKHSLYASHNFFILCGEKTFGMFVDAPGTVTFDVGETVYDTFKITVEKDCVVYTVEGDSLKDIVKQFRQLIGRSYIAPKWAFGYQQCRWSYETADAVREVVRKHRENNVPLDAVYLDIDYMERYKDFTIDENSFPEFPAFVDEMKKENIHLVPIIDAGVKIEEGYDVYEEGVEKNYFCKDEEGNDFVAAVWPGKVHFPDVLNSEARAWFGEKYRWLIDQGIDGFWNDMNEPSIFYSEKRLNETIEKVAELKGKNLDLVEFFHMKDIIFGLSNSPEDYASFYHDMDGLKVRHDKVHNLYGYNMTKAASEAFDKIDPEHRILMFSRSSYIGMHRYGGIWTGDNAAWWAHLLQSVQQMPALNMCGLMYVGSDIGGFGEDTTEDLLMRWLEFGLFTPLMRNHAAIASRKQEVYQFNAIEDSRNIIRIRYALVPYIYSEFMKAVLKDEMYFRPLAFDYPEDAHAYKVEDQLMIGDSIMIAPVYVQNATGRYVYLPEDMLMLRMKSPEEKEFIKMEKGHHYVDIELNELVIFVKTNHVLPFAVVDKDLKSTCDLVENEYEWVGYVDKTAQYVLYTDDGISKECTPEEMWKTYEFTAEDFGKQYSIVKEV